MKNRVRKGRSRNWSSGPVTDDGSLDKYKRGGLHLRHSEEVFYLLVLVTNVESYNLSKGRHYRSSDVDLY